jgi:hypothetical protein
MYYDIQLTSGNKIQDAIIHRAIKYGIPWIIKDLFNLSYPQVALHDGDGD